MNNFWGWLRIRIFGHFLYWWRLGRKSRPERMNTIEELAKAQEAQSIETLILALCYGDAETRRQAAGELGWMEDHRAALPLIHALEDEDWRVGEAARSALVQIGAVAIPQLDKMLWHKSWEGRMAAAKVLAAIKDPAVLSILSRAFEKHPDPDIRAIGAKYLGEHPQALDILLTGLSDSSRRVRGTVAKALAGLGEIAIPGLAAALKAGEPATRKAAAMGLGGIRSVQAVEVLLEQLDENDREVREQIEVALVKIGSLAVEPLTRLMKAPQCRIRERAVRVLAEIKAPGTTDFLIQALSEELPTIRCYAASALGSMGDAKAIRALVKVLGDSDASVRCYAAAALGEIGPAALEPLVQALNSGDATVRKAAADALAEIRDAKATIPLLLQLEDPEVGPTAARALGAINPPGLAKRLTDLLNKYKANPVVTRNVCETFIHMGSQDLQHLLVELPQVDHELKKMIVTALGEMQATGSINELVSLLAEQEASLREAVIQALAQMGEAAVPALIAQLGHQRAMVRESATIALGLIGDLQAVDPLIGLLFDHDAAVRKAAAQVLGRLQDSRPLESLLRALKDENREIRWYAAQALATIADASLRKPLRRLLAREKDPQVRHCLEQALELSQQQAHQNTAEASS